MPGTAWRIVACRRRVAKFITRFQRSLGADSFNYALDQGFLSPITAHSIRTSTQGDLEPVFTFCSGTIMLCHRGFAFGFQALVLACVWGLGGGRAEAVSTPRVEQVRVGFDGSSKVGFWTPVWVQVTAAETGFEGGLLIETPDADGTEVQFELPAEPLRLAAGQTTTVLRYAKFGRLDGGLNVLLRDSGGQVQRERIAGRLLPKVLSSDTELLLTLGNDIGLPAVAQRESGNRRIAALRVTEPAALPDEWYGYDGIEVVAIPTSGEPLAARMNDRQFAALRRWVQLGGHLVLCVGDSDEWSLDAA